MATPVLDCVRDRRRADVRDAGLNGLDHLDVADDQRSLCVHFLGRIPEGLTAANVRVEGGRRVRDIQVTAIRARRSNQADLDDCLEVQVDRRGDFSPYRLCLVDVDERGRPTGPLRGLDPRYACLDFTFKVGCPSDLDCKPEVSCPPEHRPPPEISYLAKDYASFRRLMLDRLALLLPDWRERHVPDLWLTLVEVLAYTGDSLSYLQDAVATEAYLDTARQRISVRRHARLVDYQLHEGCNARAWVVVETNGGRVDLRAGDVSFVTGYPGAPGPGTVLRPEQTPDPTLFERFEPLVDDPAARLTFDPAHDRISLHTWGDVDCCLPRGATSATLRDGLPRPAPETPSVAYDQHADDQGSDGRALALAVGDALVFEEVVGPGTGDPADADPTHRHVVRLTKITPGFDALYRQPILDVEWDAEDALPFPLCLSTLGPPPDCCWLEDVTVARGNVVLVQHGTTVVETLEDVPDPAPPDTCEGECQPADVATPPVRYRPPPLGHAPMSFGEPAPGATPAARATAQRPRWARPQVVLAGLAPGAATPSAWAPQPDLVHSAGNERHFVVEVDDDGRSHLRFGDGRLGAAPDPGTTFTATYRVGNGPAGNVGAESISHLVLRGQSVDGLSLRPRNPLPATGGTAPEAVRDAKLLAPGAFRATLERAITADDYATLAMRVAAVQRAAAELVWTGSWYEADVAVDQLGRPDADPTLLASVGAALHPYRRMGHDLVVGAAHEVPLDVELTVCVSPHFLRAHVRAALLDTFGVRDLPDGTPTFFHPDNLTFGTSVAVSRLVAAARAVEGVENVVVTRLERLHQGPRRELDTGLLRLGPLEVARLDDDPGDPELGRLVLVVEGGR